jgi:hypothetical protein
MLGAKVAPLDLCSPSAVRPSGDDELVEFRAATARPNHNYGVGLLSRPRGQPWRSMLIPSLLLIGRLKGSRQYGLEGGE